MSRSLLILIFLAAALFFTGLAGRDLWEPNEPVAAEAAREMSRSGDWLLPTVNGEMYPDKPPLLFWGILLASAPGGRITETTARIPSAAAATLLVLALYLLVRRPLGEPAAFWSAASLAVSTFFVEQARYVQHDMLLLLGMSVGILALFRVADGEAPRIGWVALAAAALAFGVLAKGPVALALPAFVVAVETLFDRGLFRRWGWLLLTGLLALIPPLVYYALLGLSHGTALVEGFLFRHNVNRFVEGFDHLLPWWFFLARSPLDLLPLTLFVPAALALRPGNDGERRLARRLWIWILVPLVFFSFSASKRPVYMLPALPPLALLCGWVISGAGAEARSTRRRLAAAAEWFALPALALAGIGGVFLAARRFPNLVPPAILLAVAALAGAFLGLRELRRDRLIRAHAALVATLAVVHLVAIFRVYPLVNPTNSPRFFAETLNREVPREVPLRTYGHYKFRSGYLFYADRPLPRLEDLPALGEFLSGPGPVFVVLPREDYRKLKDTLLIDARLVAEGGPGRRRDCLISNRPPAPAAPDKAPEPPGPAARRESGS